MQTENCHLMTTTTVLVVGVRPLEERFPYNKCTFIINHNAFVSPALEVRAVSPVVEAFAIIKSTSLTFYVFKTSFQQWKLFVNSQIRRVKSLVTLRQAINCSLGGSASA
jgi:hypothetical protein